MNRHTLTARELHKALGALMRNGYGDRPVCVMRVENGVPFREDVTACFESQVYDGALIWLLIADPTPPEWVR